ncbi:MAG: efflux RND transporter periplasmic adaptor subunit [Deltaproteobacteria bacterium]|nr:efflux RND transporter periplasmic adaptor subunit [Deltaproteobacteria bacterium]
MKLCKNPVIRIFFILILVALNAQHVHGEEKYFEGIIEPSELVKVSSSVEGILEEVFFDRGETVKKDQIIAFLNSNIEKAAADLALARVDFSRRKVERNEDLYKKQLVSIHDKDEMETELKIAELQYKEAREKVEIKNIRSPVDGVVVERFLSRGEYVGDEPIMSIAQIDPLYVEVVIPSEEFGRIKKTTPATIKIENPVFRELTAIVSVVDPVIDAASSTIGVRLVLPNPGYSLPAGIKCKVFFISLQ